MPIIELSRRAMALVAIEDLAAGADIAARACFAAPAHGCIVQKIGVLMQGASAGIDNTNTVGITIRDGAGNLLLTNTYNLANQPPAANAYGDLGTPDATHRYLTANEVLTVQVDQGATANLPAFFLVVEWTPIKE